MPVSERPDSIRPFSAVVSLDDDDMVAAFMDFGLSGLGRTGTVIVRELEEELAKVVEAAEEQPAVGFGRTGTVIMRELEEDLAKLVDAAEEQPDVAVDRSDSEAAVEVNQ